MISRIFAFVAAMLTVSPAWAANVEYERPETRALVQLVDDAAALVQAKGEAAFPELRRNGSQWRHDDTYVFVLAPNGDMLVHPDPSLEGKNDIELKDVNGKPIIRGLIAAASAVPGKPAGWYHYEWTEPGALLPRWKSSYVRSVTGPAGKPYIVGSGMYNDAMERAFVVDTVTNAVAAIEREGEAAFPLFHDPTGPYRFKDAYIFVIEPGGVELVNPGQPNLEGKNVWDVKDTQGKPFVHDFFKVARAQGAGWVPYMWPKPGESVSTQKSTFVKMATHAGKQYLVGCGVYLADAPKAVTKEKKMTAPQLMALVRNAAKVFEARGEKAYPEFRKKGTKWFHGDTYFFVWNMQGIRMFHAANPEGEGDDVSRLEDVMGRPIGKSFLEAATSPTGEGWVHYLYPEPGSLFATWKSTFVKRVVFPSGKPYLIGCGIYNMDMDRAFIKDIVDRAAWLVKTRGKAAFPELRDKKGPYIFMDTYVFVDDPHGVELVNGAQPSLEGKNLSSVTDLRGKHMVRDYIDAAAKNGSAWVSYYWYRPGENTPSPKETYVRKVVTNLETYYVGAGLYPREGAKPERARKVSFP